MKHIRMTSEQFEKFSANMKTIYFGNEPTDYLITPTGDIVSLKENIISLIQPILNDANKTLKVVLYHGGRRHTLQLHWLVAVYFVPGYDPTDRNQVAIFKDGSKTNVNAENLRWGSKSEVVDRVQFRYDEKIVRAVVA